MPPLELPLLEPLASEVLPLELPLPPSSPLELPPPSSPPLELPLLLPLELPELLPLLLPEPVLPLLLVLEPPLPEPLLELASADALPDELLLFAIDGVSAVAHPIAAAPAKYTLPQSAIEALRNIGSSSLPQ